jgi:hypothetical protein
MGDAPDSDDCSPNATIVGGTVGRDEAEDAATCANSVCLRKLRSPSRSTHKDLGAVTDLTGSEVGGAVVAVAGAVERDNEPRPVTRIEAGNGFT